MADTDPASGRARLSYQRAAQLFEESTVGFTGGPFTLHQLRHSRLTHAAEDGAPTPMLMTLSGHTSVQSLAKYARPGPRTRCLCGGPAPTRRPGAAAESARGGVGFLGLVSALRLRLRRLAGSRRTVPGSRCRRRPARSARRRGR
ncbi:site-specific integrase [Nocardia xishanensis]|uniref:site-specific integrase n=1 Tax=Nocardia xishanensis TaxID=238964 RepID=UPI001FE0D901|nr:site-specific integrase [Nocardia xishanensis]